MAVIDEALKTWKARLAELEKQIAPLVTEADELREAIAKLDGLGASAKRGRRAAAGKRPVGRPRKAAASKPAPRGENRRKILAAIASEAKTAGDVAKETGIKRASVASTLTKLASDGLATKADRGYVAATPKKD
ncbi:winged helix-turn-helix domain-containing protein [Patulibacter defluvii]|uniref:winged helix-turn-helix domain-containing protein n=1 Tax=Patulibacter defluvii TaxID=3095358 RepID=UPI002A755A10|nr:winged helix-turn-helix domain-containing protein [Patulibacter sp. DM4]